MPLQKKKFDRLSQKTTINSITDVYALFRDSFKDILHITVGVNETRKFWLEMFFTYPQPERYRRTLKWIYCTRSIIFLTGNRRSG